MATELKRVPNFTSGEKMHLISLIAKKYAHILEDKKTDRASKVEKNKAWVQIEKEFNSTSPVNYYRSGDCLRRLYENRKKEVRKRVAEEKKLRLSTGGGPMPNIKTENTDEILISILNEKTVSGLPNEFDSDVDVTPVVPVINNEEYECILEINEDDGSTMNWKHYKPTDLQSPISLALKTNKLNTSSVTTSEERKSLPKAPAVNRRRPTANVRALTSSHVSEKYNLLLDKRLVLVEKQIQQIDEENQYLKEERKLKLDLLKLELAAKKTQLH